jgi:hypothetical protein
MAKRRSRKKKQYWLLRGVKALCTGLWWIVKKAGSLIGIAAHSAAERVKEKQKQHKLEQQPHYNIQAKHTAFHVTKTVSGEMDDFEQQLHKSSLIILIFGKRGSGKSALGFRVMENIHAKKNRPCFVLGVKQDVLPKWIISVDSMDEVKGGGVVLVDEGALSFGARESMKGTNKEVGKLMAIARHKGLTLLFITQNTGMIDKNVLQLADTLLIKEGSLLQLEMERTAIKKFYKKAHDAFSSLPSKRKKYVYVIDGDFEGVVETTLPSFWSTKVSKSRA